MKTLHLNLKKKWFDMILSGEKKEEYRVIKNHWANQFIALKFTDSEDERLSDSELYSTITQNLDLLQLHINGFNHFDTITFSNGYAKDRPQFEIEFKGFEIRTGNPELGAEPGIKYFVLKLGKVLNEQNINKI